MRNKADTVCVTEIRLLPCNHAHFNKGDNAGEEDASLRDGAAEFVSDRYATLPSQGEKFFEVLVSNCGLGVAGEYPSFVSTWLCS